MDCRGCLGCPTVSPASAGLHGATSGATLQVRTLREELLAARRERAMVEAREADRRREIAAIKRQVRVSASLTMILAMPADVVGRPLVDLLKIQDTVTQYTPACVHEYYLHSIL